MKTQILAILQNCRGQAQAATAREIACALRVRDSRQVRRAIRELRLEGHPIASSPTGKPGYFIPTDPDEAAHTCAVLTHQMEEAGTLLRAIRRAFNLALPSQPRQLSFLEKEAA